jgi:hypothetical protein
MSATKFVVSVERVEKTLEDDVVEVNSAIEAYDYTQQIVDKFNSVLSKKNTPYRTVTYHIVKIEEVKE